MPRRTAAGTDYNRVGLLMAVIEKRIGMHLSTCDAYVNIAGGIRMNEPAIDLAIVLALISSYKDIAIDEKTLAFGEVGLSGEIRAVSMAQQRVAEARKLGFGDDHSAGSFRAFNWESGRNPPASGGKFKGSIEISVKVTAGVKIFCTKSCC